MKPRSHSAQKSSHYSTSSQKRRYQRVQTQYSRTNKNDSFTISKNIQSFPRKGKIQFRSFIKEPEQIIQENLNLKSFINNLQGQLALQRGRLQDSKRKNIKYTKQFNREFEKQLYYSGKVPNGYMFSGIKHQYQNMKALYQQKCIQIDKVQQTLEYTNIQQLKTEVQVLQQENIFLKSNLQTYMNIKQELRVSQKSQRPKNKNYRQNSRLYSQPSEDKSQSQNINADVLAHLYAEEKESLKIAISKIKLQSQRLQRMVQKQQQLVKKIEFLQKLLIQKDNNEHASRRELKRVQKEKINLQNQINRLKELLDSQQNIYQSKLEKLKQKEAQKFQAERQIFESCLKQNSDLIQKLQKEIRFLSTMLSYWKPLDEINRQFKKQSEKDRSQSQNKKQVKSIGKNDKIQSSYRFRVNSEHAYQSQVSEIDSIRKTHNNQTQLRIYRQDQVVIKRNNTDNRSSNNALINLGDKPLKSRCQCSKKYSEKAKKTRKVDPNQIKQLGQLMRFRLIGHNISIQQVKSYFSESNNILNSDQQPNSDYISMRQIKKVLVDFPFQLKENEAVVVSRYVVQDSNNEYVYWDQNNQIDRNIAKSIIKAFIGEYHLSQKQTVNTEWTKIKRVYLQNIIKALKTIAPKGYVTLNKFNELMTGLGIEMSEQIKQWMISQIVIKSTSLEELKYDTILSM